MSFSAATATTKRLLSILVLVAILSEFFTLSETLKTSKNYKNNWRLANSFPQLVKIVQDWYKPTTSLTTTEKMPSTDPKTKPPRESDISSDSDSEKDFPKYHRSPPPRPRQPSKAPVKPRVTSSSSSASRFSKCRTSSGLTWLFGLALVVLISQTGWNVYRQNFSPNDDLQQISTPSPAENLHSSFEHILLQTVVVVVALLATFFLLLTLITVALATARYFGWRGKPWRGNGGRKESSEAGSSVTKGKSETITFGKDEEEEEEIKKPMSKAAAKSKGPKVKKPSPRSRLFSSSPVSSSAAAAATSPSKTPTSVPAAPALATSTSTAAAAAAATSKIQGSKVMKTAAMKRRRKKS